MGRRGKYGAKSRATQSGVSTASAASDTTTASTSTAASDHVRSLRAKSSTICSGLGVHVDKRHRSPTSRLGPLRDHPAHRQRQPDLQPRPQQRRSTTNRQTHQADLRRDADNWEARRQRAFGHLVEGFTQHLEHKLNSNQMMGRQLQESVSKVGMSWTCSCRLNASSPQAQDEAQGEEMLQAQDGTHG
jgi:hypothetical protein